MSTGYAGRTVQTEGYRLKVLEAILQRLQQENATMAQERDDARKALIGATAIATKTLR
jgi:hypothetical protein